MPTLSSGSVSGHSRKRHLPDSDALERAHKLRRTSSPSPRHRSCSQTCDADEESPSRPSCPQKPRSKCTGSEASVLDANQREKRQTARSPVALSPVSTWVTQLPREFESIPEPEDWDTMSVSKPPAAKRHCPDSIASEILQASERETNTTATRESNNIYKDSRYRSVMASKRSHDVDSKEGPLPDELELLEVLTTKKAALPSACTIQREHLGKLPTLLQNRSELRVCMDLHPHLAPSAEFLALLYPDQIKDLTEGYNDRWLDNLVFHEKLPQPDHTLAFSRSAFTDAELQKLEFTLSNKTKSPIFACNGGLFPFFTAEVKCGKESLYTADNANLNSMTIAQRAVFELYHRAHQSSKIHRRFLGFSMSHDHEQVWIYGHYPEIDGDKITYYRRTIRKFYYADDEGQTAAQFLWNVQTHYASLHLKRLKEAIACLQEPVAASASSPVPPQTPTASTDHVTPLTPTTSNLGPTFAKPGPPRGRKSTARARQVEQLEKDANEREERLRQEAKEELEQLKKEAKEKEERLRQEAKEELKQLKKETKEREGKLQDAIEQLKKEAKGREEGLQAELRQVREQAREQQTQFMQMLGSRLRSTSDAEKCSG